MKEEEEAKQGEKRGDISSRSQFHIFSPTPPNPRPPSPPFPPFRLPRDLRNAAGNIPRRVRTAADVTASAGDFGELFEAEYSSPGPSSLGFAPAEGAKQKENRKQGE